MTDPAPVVLYSRTPDGGLVVVLGADQPLGALPPAPSLVVHTPAAAWPRGARLGDVGTLGGFWSSIGDFFKKIGSGIKWIGVKAWENRDTILDWLQQQGGAPALADACIWDAACRTFYVISSASGTAAAFRVANTGECVGRRVIDSANIPGWLSPCVSSAPGAYDVTIPRPEGMGPPMASTLELWIRSNWAILVAGGALLVLLMLAARGGGRRGRR